MALPVVVPDQRHEQQVLSRRDPRPVERFLIRTCISIRPHIAADTGDLASLECLPGEATVGFVRDIGEKLFTVAEDLDLSSPIEQILWYQTRSFPENTNFLLLSNILDEIFRDFHHQSPESFLQFRILAERIHQDSGGFILIDPIPPAIVEILNRFFRNDSVPIAASNPSFIFFQRFNLNA